MTGAVFRVGAVLFRWFTAWFVWRFESALKQPQKTQEQLLRRMQAVLGRTAYRRHLGAWETVAPQTWREVEPWVRQQQQAEQGALVKGGAAFYVRTSGSAAARKDIPYTWRLTWTFTRMFLLWAHGVLRHGPALRQGRIFLAVTPGEARDATARGVAVGLEDDRDYLVFPFNVLLRPLLVVPRLNAAALSPQQTREVLAASLVAQERLEIISVWSPTLLLVLLEVLESNKDVLLEALRAGTIHGHRLAPQSSQRVAFLSSSWGHWSHVWPHLKLISSWTQGDAAAPARRVAGLFPHVMLQPKGLLATECAVTVPMGDHEVPLIQDVVMEGLDDEGKIVPLWDWKPGQSYELLVTTWGGLARYRLGDRVLVDRLAHATPCFHFVGRTGGTVDLAGEKMDPQFVRQVLEELMPDASGTRVLLAHAAGYVLLTDVTAAPTGEQLEAALGRSHRYAQARVLGQLGAATVTVRKDAAGWLAQQRVLDGMRWGDVKDQVLVRVNAAP